MVNFKNRVEALAFFKELSQLCAGEGIQIATFHRTEANALYLVIPGTDTKFPFTPEASYITAIAATALTSSRVLAVGSSKISLIDGGIGASLTLDVVEANITHNNLGGLTSGNPHTQYSVKVSPSVVGNFVSFNSITGGQADSGYSASSFSTSGHSHSHTALTNIGTNTHAQIDTFIGTTVPNTYAPLISPLFTTPNIGVASGTSLAVTGGFGCNGATIQTSYVSGGALNAYVTGAFGLDSDANMSALHALVVKIRAALVANGVMS